MTQIQTLVTLLIGLTTAPVFVTPSFAETSGDKTYDLLFRDGTLDNIAKTHTLVYARSVQNTYVPDTPARDTGRIELGFDGGEPLQAHLEFKQEDKHRGLGNFPASVGNPIVMYFVETVVRDMAENVGGSPFYIRNRVKEALIHPAEVEHTTVDFKGAKIAATQVTLRPFRDDPNWQRMRGYNDLALEVTMSEEVPGWYYSLVAVVPEPDSDQAAYQSALMFTALEVPQ